MFGRILDVYIDNGKNKIKLVDSDQGNKSLVCEAKIVCMPNMERTTLELSVYNLDKNTRNLLKSDEYINISVYYGYRDTNSGQPSCMFKGTLRRMITQRESPETSVTRFYAYELGDAYDYGYFSGFFGIGTSLYDVLTTIAKSGEIDIPIYVSDYYKNVYLAKNEVCFDSQIKLLQKYAGGVKDSLFSQSMGRVYITTTTENKSTEIIVFSGVNENNELISSSGLIGLPSLEDDGLSFECLPNPNLRIYSIVLIANSFISDAQMGFEKNSQAGAEFDENGLYVVTKITTNLYNDARQSKMSVRALARQYYEEGQE